MGRYWIIMRRDAADNHGWRPVWRKGPNSGTRRFASLADAQALVAQAQVSNAQAGRCIAYAVVERQG